MSSFCIIERSNEKHHAGSKARKDVADILIRNGFEPICVHHSNEKGLPEKLYMCIATFADWFRVSHKVKPYDTLLIQYPLAMYPRVSEIAALFLHKMKRKKIRLVLLFHDLESLRGLNFKSEKMFLERADEVIVHNSKMKKYLEDTGYHFRKTYILRLFDYLIPEFVNNENKDRNSVAIAGNLRSEKCGYLQFLPELPGKVSYHLYGPYYEMGKEQKNVLYKGDFPPDRLPMIMKEGWGLVWDGNSIQTCSGAYGEYLRYNNPHKMSLYLACGIPVIVWKDSALATWVTQNNVGIAIGSLDELSDRIEKISGDEYEDIQRNAAEVGSALRAGKMLTEVVEELIVNAK